MTFAFSSPLVEFAPAQVELLADFTDLQRAQLLAAANYHALQNPQSVLELRIGVGDIHQMPALTDRTTVLGESVQNCGVTVTVTGRSLAHGSVQLTAPERPVVRWIRLAHPAATPATTQPVGRLSAKHRAYRVLEKESPELLDIAREAIMTKREQDSSKYIARYDLEKAAQHPEHFKNTWPHLPQLNLAESTQKAVLFGLHWLQTGGAERWAIESIAIAKESGLLPIVVTDQNSVHPWLTLPELKDCVVITMSFSHHHQPLDVRLGHALLENFNIVGVMLHHCHWLYHMLPWLKQQNPQLPIIDSLHIVEYLGGGYPGISSHFDDYIDVHHVISPALLKWLTRNQRVDTKKIALAPLAELTAEGDSKFKPRNLSRPFTISFIGRLSRQKRPDIFLRLVNKVKKLGQKQGVEIHAILYGDGEMRDIVESYIDRFKLRGIVEQRFSEKTVTETLQETDLLTITSINEGITLTTFEAAAAGVPVLSADVGSQETIVQGELLVPRPGPSFINQAAKVIIKLALDEQAREQAWQEQQARITEFKKLPTAHSWTKETFEKWQM
ncbi:glycosyltransferase [Leucobacter sp. OH2974_COT-288]|nr:glycosyltransferase [Leucobacter sp. OH2974_COT-288]